MSLVKSESSCGDDEEDGGGFRFFWFPRFGGKTSEDIISVSKPVSCITIYFVRQYNSFHQWLGCDLALYMRQIGFMLEEMKK